MKKLLSVMLAISLLLGTITGLSGCGKKEGAEILTRSAWISMLAKQYNLTKSSNEEPVFTDVKSSNPNFQAVQSCAEWEIVEKTGEFKPDDNAKNEFAIVTAVKAIGIARLEKSDYKASLKTNEEILSFFKLQSGLSVSSDKKLTQKQAEEILAKAQDISAGLTLPQVYDVDYKENVKEMTLNQVTFSADGRSATLKSGSVNVGDIIVVEPNKYLPSGKYAKVTAVNGADVKYTAATIEETCEDLTIQGTYTPEIYSVVPRTAGVTVVSAGGAAVDPVSSPNNSGTVKATALGLKHDSNERITPLASAQENLGSVAFDLGVTIDGIQITGTVSIEDIKVTLDLPTVKVLFAEVLVPGDVYFRADYKMKESIKVSVKANKTIPLATFDLGLPGLASAYAGLVLKLGIDGSISVSLEAPVMAAADFKMGSGLKAEGRVGSFEPEVEVKVAGYVRPALQIAAQIAGKDFASVGCYVGLEGELSVPVFKNGEVHDCVDLQLWVSAACFANADVEIGVKIVSEEAKYEIFDKSNSFFKPNWHFENWIKVDKCTYDGESSASNNTPGDNIDEELLDYSFGDGLTISAFYVALNPNTGDKLIVTHIPGGYSAGDLSFTSDKPNVVSVDNSGNMLTKNEGTAIIKVATSDGKYEQFCVVSIFTTISGEFSPLI